MKFLLISVGTRGDVEPFLAIAELLKEKGHKVICAFPEQFRNLVDDNIDKFVGLTPKFIELVESESGKKLMGGGGSIFKKIREYRKLYKLSSEVNKELVFEQQGLIEQEKPDRIIYSAKAIYPVIWGINHPNRSIIVSPIPCLIHYVKEHPHVGLRGSYGAFFNKLSYSLINFVLTRHILNSAKELRISPNIEREQIKMGLLTGKMIYSVSPSIFPRPGYWPANVYELGYHERDKTLNWEADENLKHFISGHDNIIFITFGSMVNPDPVGKTKIILDILEEHQIAAIVNTASGGLIEPDKYNRSLVHFVKQIPYDWIFPKVYGVIHHGGSGTTHMALKYGCASMIIPHIIDQYLWNDLISNLEVGPKGIAMSKLTRNKLEPKIMSLIQDNSYKTRALEVAESMKKENFREELYKTITG